MTSNKISLIIVLLIILGCSVCVTAHNKSLEFSQTIDNKHTTDIIPDSITQRLIHINSGLMSQAYYITLTGAERYYNVSASLTDLGLIKVRVIPPDSDDITNLKLDRQTRNHT